ncbi:MAG: hypothetical protein JSS66_02205 [Armatimonadetes bacterium]|nr:hypothetical protein [Armatimonadota bacterium]
MRLLFVALLSLPCFADASLVYTYRELRGPFAGPAASSEAFSINDRGSVAGDAGGSDGWFSRLWQPDGSVVTLLPSSGQQASYAYCLSASGRFVVGATYGSSGERACLWDNGIVQDLGMLPGYTTKANALSVNDAGQAVGWSYNGNTNGWAAWKLVGGTLVKLPELPGGTNVSGAYGVGPSGIVTGWSKANGYLRAVSWDAQGVHDLLPPSGPPQEGYGNCINAFGEISGGADFGLGSAWQPVVYRDGQATMLDLYTGSNGYGRAQGINDCGVCTGPADNPANSNTTEAALWTRDGRIFNLMDLAGMPRFNGTTGWGDTQPTAINNKGQVVGTGTYSYSAGHARGSGFLLTPVSTIVPPTSLTVVAGKQTSGNLQSLASVDGDALAVCRFIVPNQQADPVQVRVEASLAWAPMALWFKSTAKVTQVGAYSLSLSLYDWQASMYDSLTATISPLTTSYSNSEAIAKGDVLRFVRSGDHQVRALLKVRAAGPSASSAWCAQFDQAVWEAVPLP